MSDLLLGQLMDEVEDEAMYSASRGELRQQPLAIQRANGERIRHRLSVPGVHPATAAKLVIASVTDAAYAALAFEGWMVELGPESPPELRGLLENGVIAPSEAPPEFRRDILWIVGEGRDGARATWRFSIDPPRQKGGLRTFREHEYDWEKAVVEKDRFRPLFAPPEEIRRLLRQVAGR